MELVVVSWCCCGVSVSAVLCCVVCMKAGFCEFALNWHALASQ